MNSGASGLLNKLNVSEDKNRKGSLVEDEANDSENTKASLDVSVVSS